MLFLVISTPRPEKPTSMASTRHSYWDWMNPLLESGLAVSVHARVGRGAVALFDVDSTETLECGCASQPFGAVDQRAAGMRGNRTLSHLITAARSPWAARRQGEFARQQAT